MDRKRTHTPFFEQLVKQVHQGLLMLDESSQNEIREFVKSQQHKNGAFINRSGKPDLYYSLFGVWLSEALQLTAQQKELKRFIAENQADKLKTIDEFATFLILKVLCSTDCKKPGIFKMIKMVLLDGKNINTAYRLFLFLLSYDAYYGKNRFVYFLINPFLRLFRFSGNEPCSIIAAFMVVKYTAGRNVEKELKVLFNYFENGKGFKFFQDAENPDLLSTAVALFAIKMVGGDNRLVAPDCLTLVQQNYANGAFISGDGDETRDLEYTFYGLLALGTISTV